MKKLLLALKLFRRNAKSGEAKVLLVALLIAVTSVTTVAFFADRVESALNTQANEMIAADLVVITDKPTPERFRTEAARLQLNIAESVTFPSMVAGDEARGQGVNLAEIKAITNRFPLRGKIRIADAPGAADRDADGIPAPGSVWIPEILLTRLNAVMGDEIKIGEMKFKIAAVLVKEPDSVLDYFGIAPRAMLNRQDLAATR